MYANRMVMYQNVRNNVYLLVVFRQDDVNLKHIHDDHVNTDMSYNRFKELCGKCWENDNHRFLLIDKDRVLNEERYRKNFDCFIINI